MKVKFILFAIWLADKLFFAETFFRALFYHLFDDKATRELKRKRLEVCNTCEFKRGSTCGKCGCILVLKTRIKTETCPEGKW